MNKKVKFSLEPRNLGCNFSIEVHGGRGIGEGAFEPLPPLLKLNLDAFARVLGYF